MARCVLTAPTVSRLVTSFGIGAIVATAAAGCTRDTTGAPAPAVASTTAHTASAPSTITIATITTATITIATITTGTSTPGTSLMTTVPPTAAPSAVPAITPTASTQPTAPAGTTSYVVPVADVAGAGWADEHHDYPATDVFVGCGAEIVAPVDGALLEVRRVDGYDSAIDNPATRGGRSISILGDDGVRYYLAHLETIDDVWAPGARVTAGSRLGTMGRTGRAGACHLHVAISPPCPGAEWSVRRGVVWPYPYLDAWRDGQQLSPVDEVAAWAAAHPTACADAMADPNAADA